MSERNLDELLKTLKIIAGMKGVLPFQLRGWVNALGLYVQARPSGQGTRMQAGGKFRSYLDVWEGDEGQRQIRKFDEDTWGRRFAHLVEPTYEIADFLSDRVTFFGDLDSEGASTLAHTLQHYGDTGVWLKLPKVPEEVINRLAEEIARASAQKEREKRLRSIAIAESDIRKDPMHRSAWSLLELLYYEEQRYKDMETALKMSLKIDAARPYSITYKLLGNLYLAALSVSLRGKGIGIFFYTPSNVTSEALGYDIEELRALAKESFSKAYEMEKKAGYKEEDLRELELALKAVGTLSVEAFEEFDRYKELERQQEERRQQELFDKHKDEEGQKDL